MQPPTPDAPAPAPASAPTVKDAVLEILARDKFVSPISLFVQLGMLKKRDLLDWKAGRVQALELVIAGNLTRLRSVLAELGSVARAMGLKPSRTAYKRKTHTLRFSRSGAPSLETLYSTHFVGQELVDAARERKKPGSGRAAVTEPPAAEAAPPKKKKKGPKTKTWKKHAPPWAEPETKRARKAKPPKGPESGS